MTLAIVELGGRVLGLDLRSALDKSRRYGHRVLGIVGLEDPAGDCPGCGRATDDADGFCSFCDHSEGEAAADALADAVADGE